MVERIFDVINTIVIVYDFADFLGVEVCRRTAISTGLYSVRIFFVSSNKIGC